MRQRRYQGLQTAVGLGPSPQKTERAVRVHVIFTQLMCALATAWVPPKADIDLAFLPIPEDCR